jgi:hypothetical protein
MHVPLTQTVEDELRTRAIRRGMTPESYASQLIEEAVSGLRLHEIVGTIPSRFEQSGMTDDRLGDLLEAEKHAARAERQSSSAE